MYLRDRPAYLTATFYRDLGEWVHGNIDNDGDEFAADLRDILFGWEEGFDRCQSPIEQRLFGKLLFLTNGFRCIKYLGAPGIDQKFATVFVSQMTLGPYIADFAFMSCCNGRVAKLIVECDGHEWHEKTKEQAQRDKVRDRHFVRNDWQVLRFTGSEINRDAAACAEEIDIILGRITDPIVRQAEEEWQRERGVRS